MRHILVKVLKYFLACLASEEEHDEILFWQSANDDALFALSKARMEIVLLKQRQKEPQDGC